MAQTGQLTNNNPMSRTEISPKTLAWLLVCAGCMPSFGEPEPEAPPPPELGENEYLVSGTLKSETCGPGQLVFPTTLNSVVGLVVEEGVVHYENGGSETSAELDAELGFVIESSVTIDLRTAEDAGLPPCKITRTDTIALALDDQEATGFAGTFTIDYRPSAESKCDDLLVGANRLTTALPCRARYAVSGSQD